MRTFSSLLPLFMHLIARLSHKRSGVICCALFVMLTAQTLTKQMLDEIYWDREFDPLLYWQFVPVCAFEVDGTEEMSHTYRHNRLFGMNGYRLDSSVGKGTAAMSTVTESYELWLLEDMSLAVTFCCQMTVADRDDNCYETAEYRYPVTGSYAALTGDFYVENFIESVAEQIFSARHMD